MKKIEWDLTNGPLSKVLGILDTQILRFFRGPWTVGPVGDFLESFKVHDEVFSGGDFLTF